MTDEDWASVYRYQSDRRVSTARARQFPSFARREGSWIINIASLAGRNYFPNGAAYCASKAGL
jgi:NADP-dependent 3-hydroxy acid dehydrogenase YdfG